MQRIFAKLPAFTGAAVGTQPTCTPDILGRSFDFFMLKVVGTKVTADAAMDFNRFVDQVDILVDGKVVSTYYPKQERAKALLFNANGDTIPTAFFHIPFVRPGIPNSEWGTSDLKSIQIRCTIPSSFATGGALTRIEGWMGYYLEDAPRGEAFVNRVVTPVTPGAGTNVIDRLEIGALARIRNLFFTCPPAAANLTNGDAEAITRVQVTVANTLVFDMEKDTVSALLAVHPLYKLPATQYGFFVPFDLNNQAPDFQTVRIGDTQLPVRVEYFWDTTITATPAAIQIIIEGTEGVKLVPAK